MRVKHSILNGYLPILTALHTQATKPEFFYCCCSFVIKNEYHFYLGEECNIISITCAQCTFGLGKGGRERKLTLMSSFSILFSRYTPVLYTLTHRVCSLHSQNTNTVLAGKYMPNSLRNIILKRSLPNHPALQGASITKNQPTVLDKGMNLNYPCILN